MDNARGHHNEFCKGTIAAVVAARDTQHLTPITEVYVTAAAVAALATIHSRIKSDTIAFGEATCARAGFGNGPRGFVTHHQWRDAPSRRAVIAMNVAATDPTRRHAHQNFVASGRWDRNVSNFEMAVLREEKSFHLKSSETPTNFAKKTLPD
jgi:hypothetical protein